MCLALVIAAVASSWIFPRGQRVPSGSLRSACRTRWNSAAGPCSPRSWIVCRQVDRWKRSTRRLAPSLNSATDWTSSTPIDAVSASSAALGSLLATQKPSGWLRWAHRDRCGGARRRHSRSRGEGASPSRRWVVGERCRAAPRHLRSIRSSPRWPGLAVPVTSPSRTACLVAPHARTFADSVSQPIHAVDQRVGVFVVQGNSPVWGLHIRDAADSGLVCGLDVGR